SKILLYFCLSFILGIFLNSVMPISQILLLGVFTPHIILCGGLILGILLISVFWRYKRLVVIGFCILLLVAGIWRHQAALLRILNNELRSLNNREEKIELIGVIVAEPDIREKSTKLTIEVEEIKTENGSPEIEGRVLVTAWKYPQYQYGNKLKITGRLEEPQTFEGFNYKDYLAKDGIYSVMYFPKIELIGKGFGNSVIRTLFSFKNELKESLNRAMPSPQAGLLEALFFGDEGNISKAWKDKFNLTGTRHITAVSGMNITIVSVLILNFLLSFGLWRNQAFYFSIILISLYILMTGAPASVIRAGIMGVLFLTAQHFGRISSGSRAIVFAAALMLFLNPLLLKLDIGFQLSFLAMMGLIYLQPILLDLFKKIPKIFQFRYTLASTLAAQFFTFPILIYNFGQIPLVGPLANIFIIPLLPIITILGFIFSFLGIIFQPLGQTLSWPAWLLLTYILKIIDFSAKIPFATLTFENAHWVWLLISYLILGFVTWRLQESQKLKFLNY
ncbi:MAG: ComEC/Rec2 family competence protein, partial [Candidatus Paceibacterales bacterium]